MILISKQYQLHFQEPIPKILQINPVLNGFLFIATTEDGLTERIVHIDNNSKILWQKEYNDSIDMFGILRQDEAIVLNVKQNLIDLIDLNTHEISSIVHHYQMNDTSYMDIVIFSQTNIFAVIEKNIKKEEQRFVITYYHRQEGQYRKIIAIKKNENYKATDIHIGKVNNHSKIAVWSSNALRKLFIFETIDFQYVQSKAEEVRSAINVPHSLNIQYEKQNLLISILHINQISTNKYLLICDSNRIAEESPNQINNNYILDAEQKTIRQFGFFIPNGNYHLSGFHSFNSYTAFLTFQTTDGSMANSPIFYVDNRNESVVAKETWKATNKSNIIVNQFDSSMLIEAIHDNSNVNEVKIITKRLTDCKEIYLHFMLHIEEDFDDDLLSDAIVLLAHE